MMNYYPLNRELVFDLDSDLYHLTISGQLIIDKLNIDSMQNFEERLNDDSYFLTNNPCVLKEDYLIRNQLESLNTWLLEFLKFKKRTLKEIINAAEIIRDEIWTSFNDWSNVANLDELYTGEQYEERYSYDYHTWQIYSDIFFPLEFVEDDWRTGEEWMTKNIWTYPEIYAVLSLWAIDEAVVYINKNNPIKSCVWLTRAIDYRFLTGEYNKQNDVSNNARLGGNAKAAKYQPLKDLAKELVDKRNKWSSRRNAAMTITPKILEEASRLNIALSKDQASITIQGWLKEMGLPANI